jgi:hypothetical protein
MATMYKNVCGNCVGGVDFSYTYFFYDRAKSECSLHCF